MENIEELRRAGAPKSRRYIATAGCSSARRAVLVTASAFGIIYGRHQQTYLHDCAVVSTLGAEQIFTSAVRRSGLTEKARFPTAPATCSRERNETYLRPTLRRADRQLVHYFESKHRRHLKVAPPGLCAGARTTTIILVARQNAIGR